MRGPLTRLPCASRGLGATHKLAEARDLRSCATASDIFAAVPQPAAMLAHAHGIGWDAPQAGREGMFVALNMKPSIATCICNRMAFAFLRSSQG